MASAAATSAADWKPAACSAARAASAASSLPSRRASAASRAALPEGRVEGHLGGVELHVLDGVVLARADVAGPVRGVGEGDLEHQVELGGQHLAAVEDPDEVRAHEHGAGARGRDGFGVAPAVRQEALDVPVQPPLLRLQEAVQIRAAVVVGDVLNAGAVGEDLDAVDEGRRVRRAELQRGRGGVVAHREAELDRLPVHEVHAACDWDAAHAARGRREDAQTRRVVDHILAALHVIDVARLELVVEALDQLVVHGSSHLLHGFTLPERFHAASGSLALRSASKEGGGAARDLSEA